jgi:hypothetical protein
MAAPSGRSPRHRISLINNHLYVPQRVCHIVVTKFSLFCDTAYLIYLYLCNVTLTPPGSYVFTSLFYTITNI